MSCIINIEYPHPKEEAIQKLKKSVEDNGGRFEGDIHQGHFRVGTPVGAFEAAYTIVDDTVTINVIKKPIVISCKRIKEEIEKYLRQNPHLNEIQWNSI